MATTTADLEAPHGPMIFAGKSIDGHGTTFDRRSPGHDIVAGTYAAGTEADVDAVVTAAGASFDSGPWRWASGADKARVLRGVASRIEAEARALAARETLESGKPIAQARKEMVGAAEIWYCAATLTQHAYGPRHRQVTANVSINGRGHIGTQLTDVSSAPTHLRSREMR